MAAVMVKTPQPLKLPVIGATFAKKKKKNLFSRNKDDASTHRTGLLDLLHTNSNVLRELLHVNIQASRKKKASRCKAEVDRVCVCLKEWKCSKKKRMLVEQADMVAVLFTCVS